MNTKTDNKSLGLKVVLRKKVIREAGLKQLRVLDLYAGKGLVWKAVRESIPLAAYTPVDRKPGLPGTIKAEVTDADILRSITRPKNMCAGRMGFA